MKIMMLSNQSRSMAGFWRVLIQTLLRQGCQVTCCVPYGDPDSDAKLTALGAELIYFDLDRKGINPIKDARTWLQLRNIFSSKKPDFLFATTIKPVIYGCSAAHSAGIANIYATITGLGYVFERDSIFKKFLNRLGQFLYRASLKYAKGIFFQNMDDRELFLEQQIVGKSSPILYAPGTGVDISHFAQMPIPDPRAGIKFLLVGRLLEAKGIEDYAKAAAIIKRKWPKARFQLLGVPETGPGSIPLSMLAKWGDSVEYLGQTDDVRPYLGAAHVVVLPSWREGLPTALLEAMSVGRPLVATNVAGCRDVVRDGKNGFLAEVRNPESLAAAMEQFLENPALIAEMGQESRRMAVAKFDANLVAENIISDMGIWRKQ